MTNEFFLSLLIPFICLPILVYHKEIANITGLIDYPDHRKTHNKPIPKIGGIFFLSCSTIFILIQSSNFNERLIFSFLILTFGFFFIGLVDDKIKIKASARLLLQFIVITLSINIDFNLNIENLSVGLLDANIKIYQGSILFSIFCIISLTNAINLLDGKDGLAVSVFLIYLIIIYLTNPGPISIFYPILIISSILFLIYNIRGKLFLGNSGAYLIGGIISFITIQNYNNSNYPIEIIFLMFYLYGLDMLRVYLERLFRGKHPFTAENNHLHHYIYSFSKNKFVNLVIYILLLYIPITIHYFYKNYYILLILTSLIYLGSLFFFKKFEKK